MNALVAWQTVLPTESFLIASLMMGVVGVIAWLVNCQVAIDSFRLRSLIALVVLVQGLMIFRAPIHLGLVEADTPGVSFHNFGDQIAVDSVFPAEGNSASHSDLAMVNAVENKSRSHSGERSLQQAFWDAVTSVDWSRILFATWISVVTMFVIQMVWSYVRILRFTKRLRPAPDAWSDEWSNLVRASGRKQTLDCEMLVSESVGPLIVRQFDRYSLIVPSEYWSGLTETQRRAVLLHELAHMERHDVWRQFFARSIAVFHWFNPMAWWALRQYELATEYACDARIAGCGRRAKTEFASALLSYVQWSEEKDLFKTRRMIFGYQTMAAPPLSNRVKALLESKQSGESKVKRSIMFVLVCGLAATSFFHLRLTKAEEIATAELSVLEEDIEAKLNAVVPKMDRSDTTTNRFAELFNTPSGKIAIAGMLNSIRGQARQQAQAESLPRFLSKHFVKSEDDSLALRESSGDDAQRWIEKGAQFSRDVSDLRAVMKEISDSLDQSHEASGLFKRFLDNEYAPAALLITEMGGGDMVSRFISEAMNKILVEKGDGSFSVVESRREEAEKLLQRLEMADKIAIKLKRELPELAQDFSDSDDRHREFIKYLEKPTMASFLAGEVAEKARSVSDGIDKIHDHLEEVSRDTATGLVIDNEEAWRHLEEIFAKVDRSDQVASRVRQRLTEVAETLSGDELTKRLAKALSMDVAVERIASEIPYADANVGDELNALVSEVLIDSDGKKRVDDSRAEELSAKMRELLQVCRKVRRYSSEVSEVLDKFESAKLVSDLGSEARFVMLDEVRRFAERHRPDPVELMKQFVLEQSAQDRWVVRQDRRDVVRELIQQAENVRAEAAKDDF